MAVARHIVIFNFYRNGEKVSTLREARTVRVDKMGRNYTHYRGEDLFVYKQGSEYHADIGKEASKVIKWR